MLAGLGMALAVAKAYREPPGVSMPPDAMGRAGGKGQVQGSPGLPEEEAGGSPENSRSHRLCKLREKPEAYVSGADAHWQVRGCGSRWDTGTKVSGLKQGDEGSVRRASGRGRGKAGACSLRWAWPRGSCWGPRPSQSFRSRGLCGLE